MLLVRRIYYSTFNVFRLKTNDFVILNPQVEHTRISSPDSPLEIFVVVGIKACPSQILSVDQSSAILFVLLIYEMNKGHLRYKYNGARSHGNHALSYDLVCHNLLEILLIKIFKTPAFDLESRCSW